jgi:hypothetical protein
MTVLELLLLKPDASRRPLGGETHHFFYHNARRVHKVVAGGGKS